MLSVDRRSQSAPLLVGVASRRRKHIDGATPRAVGIDDDCRWALGIAVLESGSTKTPRKTKDGDAGANDSCHFCAGSWQFLALFWRASRCS